MEGNAWKYKRGCIYAKNRSVKDESYSEILKIIFIKWTLDPTYNTEGSGREMRKFFMSLTAGKQNRKEWSQKKRKPFSEFQIAIW